MRCLRALDLAAGWLGARELAQVLVCELEAGHAGGHSFVMADDVGRRRDELVEVSRMFVAIATAALLGAHRAAVRHVLNVRQENPDVGWYIGWGTESFELLCAAEALVLEQPPDLVCARRNRDLQPEYRRRRPEIVVLRERVHQLESLLDEHGIDVP